MELKAFYGLPGEWWELQRGDWVAWNRSALVRAGQVPIVVGQIVRMAKNKTWVDVRYRIPEEERGDLAVEWEISHRTQRLNVLYVRKVERPGEESGSEETR